MFPRTISCTGDTGRPSCRTGRPELSPRRETPQDAVLSFRPGSWLPGEAAGAGLETPQGSARGAPGHSQPGLASPWPAGPPPT